MHSACEIGREKTTEATACAVLCCASKLYHIFSIFSSPFAGFSPSFLRISVFRKGASTPIILYTFDCTEDGLA